MSQFLSNHLSKTSINICSPSQMLWDFLRISHYLPNISFHLSSRGLWEIFLFQCDALQATVCNLFILIVHLISPVLRKHSADGARWQPIPVSGSWWQVLYITGGAKEMTSCPCRGWKRSPDRTVMTKEFLGNIRVHRRQGEKIVWRLCFLSSCSSRLPLLAHQPFSDVWNSPLTCASFFVLNVGHGGGAESSPN